MPRVSAVHHGMVCRWELTPECCTLELPSPVLHVSAGREVEERLTEDRVANDRMPQTLTLGFSSSGAARLPMRRTACQHNCTPRLRRTSG